MKPISRWTLVACLALGLSACTDDAASTGAPDTAAQPEAVATSPAAALPTTPVKTVPDAPAQALGSLGEGEVVTPSGLHILDIVVGDGTEAVNGMSVSMEYAGTFLSGEEFDSNVGGTPLTFTLGNDAIIQGWHEGVVGMKVGGQRRLGVPPELAYGAQGHPAGIPPNTPLLFDIKLVDAK